MITAPWTFLPKKSSADCKSDLRNIVVTSETVRIRSAGIGSERGVGAEDAAGVPETLFVGRGAGAGWRISTL